MDSPEERLDPVDRLAGEFLERRRRGERPTIEEYVARHPEFDEKIRDVFSALLLIENFGSVEEERSSSSTPPAAPAFSELRELGDFRILRRIGRGGMGIVFEAEQVSLGRRVALKILPFHSLLSPDRLRRFQLEARAAARLHHPNIVPIHEVGEANGTHYYAMQFIEGQGLDEVLEEIRRLQAADSPASAAAAASADPRSGLVATELLSGRFRASGSAVEVDDSAFESPVPASLDPRSVAVSRADRDDSSSSVVLPGQTGRSSSSDTGTGYFRSVALVGVQVSEALAHAHAAGVLHRDIKPSNLLLDLKGTVWVTDFGLAKAEGAEDVTQSGDIVGTLRYMGPERFKGWSDPRSDIYGLGATLYELLTLRPAFPSRDRATLVREILHADPPPPRRLDRRIPRDLETIVLKAMEKEPRKRYPSAAELAEDLKRFLDRRPIVARRATPGERLGLWFQRSPLVASLAVAVAVLLLAVTVISVSALLRFRNLAYELQGKQNELQEKQAATVASLRRAYLEEAGNRRLSRRIGQRIETLKALKLAAEIEPGVDLRNQAIAALALVDLNHTVPEWRFGDHKMSRIAFDPSFERYAWSDEKGGIHLHRLADRSEILALPGPGSTLWRLWFSPDGRRIAAIHGEGLTLCDLDARVSRPVGGGFRNGRVDFSPDSRVVAAGGDTSGGIQVIDCATGEILRTLRGGGHLGAVRVHPDGRRVAASYEPNGVLIWNLKSGALLRTLAVGANPKGLAWHPSGKVLAVGDQDGRVHLGDPEAWESRRTLTGHRWTVIRLEFSPRGDILTSFGWDKRTILWDPSLGEKLLEYEAEAVNFSRDGRLLGFQFLDRAEVFEVLKPTAYRRVWSQPDNPQVQDVPLYCMTFSPRGDLLVFRTPTELHIRAAPSGEDLARVKLPSRSHAVLFAELDGLKLITVSDSQIHTWPVERVAGASGDQLLKVGPPHRLYQLENQRNADDRFWAASLQRGGTLLVFSHWGHPHLLDIARPAHHRRYSGHSGLVDLQISPDGRWIAGGILHAGTGVPVWDVEIKERQKVIPAHDSASAAFSPDSQWLVVCNGIDYRFYRTGTWEEGLVVERHRIDEPPGLSTFSADGRLLLTNPTLSLVRLMDPATGREFAKLEPPHEAILFLWDLSPDGSLFAAGTQKAFAHLWDLRTVRRELATLGLDWDLPPYPEPAPERPRIAGVEVLLGELDPRSQKGEEAAVASKEVAGDLVRAVGDDLKPAEATPGDPASRFARGFKLREEGKHAEAIQVFRALADGDPENPDFLNALAWEYLTAPGDLARKEEAMALSLRAVGLIGRRGEPNGTDLLYLALAKSRLADPVEARQAYHRALAWRARIGNLSAPERAIFETVLAEARRVLGVSE